MLAVRYLVAIFCVLLLDGTVGVRMAIAGIRPDFALALVVYAGLYHGRPVGVGVGFLVGLLRGCAEPEWFGLEALLLPWVGFAAGSTSALLNRAHPYLQAFLIGLLLMAHDLVRALIVTAVIPADALSLWASSSPATAVYTAVVVPLAVLWLPQLFLGRRARALR